MLRNTMQMVVQTYIHHENPQETLGPMNEEYAQLGDYIDALESQAIVDTVEELLTLVNTLDKGNWMFLSIYENGRCVNQEKFRLTDVKEIEVWVRQVNNGQPA